MKKIVLFFVVAFAFALIVSACGTTKECPAYGQAEVEVESVC